jgi:hypothetical protein
MKRKSRFKSLTLQRRVASSQTAPGYCSRMQTVAYSNRKTTKDLKDFLA